MITGLLIQTVHFFQPLRSLTHKAGIHLKGYELILKIDSILLITFWIAL